MKKYLIILLAALLIVLTFGAFSMSAAQATRLPAERHNTIADISCEIGFNLDSDSYDAALANKFEWVVGSKSDSGTFPDALHVHVDLSQDGATTDWSYDVQAEDGSYHFSDHGTVGPCGTVTPPPVETKIAHIRIQKYDVCSWQADNVRIYERSHVRKARVVETKRGTWLITATADNGYRLRKWQHGGPLVKSIHWTMHTKNQRHCGPGGGSN